MIKKNRVVSLLAGAVILAVLTAGCQKTASQPPETTASQPPETT